MFIGYCVRRSMTADACAPWAAQAGGSTEGA
jgi:hypothetical protein